MLGSRFNLAEVVTDLSVRDQPATEASCRELEREIADIARSVHTASARVKLNCPVCDSPMRLGDECALSEFGALDVKLHKLECDTCGMLAGRVYHPTVGYDEQTVR